MNLTYITNSIWPVNLSIIQLKIFPKHFDFLNLTNDNPCRNAFKVLPLIPLCCIVSHAVYTGTAIYSVHQGVPYNSNHLKYHFTLCPFIRFGLRMQKMLFKRLSNFSFIKTNIHFGTEVFKNSNFQKGAKNQVFSHKSKF